VARQGVSHPLLGFSPGASRLSLRGLCEKQDAASEWDTPCPAFADTLTAVSLASDFRQVLDSLPPDWTDLELDLRIADESEYIDTAVALSQVNAQPYSQADWDWRLLVAQSFGHAAAAETVLGVLEKLDGEGVAGEMQVREVREGRAEVVQMWGRPESVREEFRQRRSL
jgi:hypothetical protein